MMHVDESIAIYQVGCFVLLPTYCPIKPYGCRKQCYSDPTKGITTKLDFFL
jgi:hypothetical protein